MQFTIITLTGQTIVVDVTPDMTVTEFKAAVQSQFSNPSLPEFLNQHVYLNLVDCNTSNRHLILGSNRNCIEYLTSHGFNLDLHKGLLMNTTNRDLVIYLQIPKLSNNESLAVSPAQNETLASAKSNTNAHKKLKRAVMSVREHNRLFNTRSEKLQADERAELVRKTWK